MKPNLTLALDFQDKDDISHWINFTDGVFEWYKVGLEAFYSYGDYAIAMLLDRQKKVFLDLKLSDIPNTVYKATRAILKKYPVDMLNVHLLSGSSTIRAFKQAVEEMSGFHGKKILAIGVTLLTSLDDRDLRALNIDSLEETVLRLAHMGHDNGLDGVVCSTYEASLVKGLFGHEFKTVCPGIKIGESVGHDQKRTATLEEAIPVADFIVIGRSLTSADDPEAILRFLKERWESLS
ncbi:orotidine-5'-phosphate decarboxylase [Coprothermobacteraceae bacterium]|nr:orotidine-5'-phosphate decarboxylase [Coprothermobacteraceae bacterium]